MLHQRDVVPTHRKTVEGHHSTSTTLWCKVQQKNKVLTNPKMKKREEEKSSSLSFYFEQRSPLFPSPRFYKSIHSFDFFPEGIRTNFPSPLAD